ncbi:MAG: MFS transporter, partial [Rubripirellula sp.]
MSIRIRLSIMMFLQFFVWGAFFVTMGTYLGVIFAEYEEKGTLNSIIGSAYATQTWAAVFAPLIVGFVADRLFNKERVNAVLHLLGGGILWWCSSITESPDVFFWGMLAFFLCYMPTLALVNAITFQNVNSIEREFPQIRLWGTIGWIVSGLVVSQSLFGIFDIPFLPNLLLDFAAATNVPIDEALVNPETGVLAAAKTSLPLKLAAVVSIIYGVYSFTLPASPPQGRDQPISFSRVLGLDAVSLFKNPNYSIFALCSFLICIPLAFYYAR